MSNKKSVCYFVYKIQFGGLACLLGRNGSSAFEMSHCKVTTTQMVAKTDNLGHVFNQEVGPSAEMSNGCSLSSNQSLPSRSAPTNKSLYNPYGEPDLYATGKKKAAVE